LEGRVSVLVGLVKLADSVDVTLPIAFVPAGVAAVFCTANVPALVTAALVTVTLPIALLPAPKVTLPMALLPAGVAAVF
jgi:hypothetical protein